jgi:hypothetical protein
MFGNTRSPLVNTSGNVQSSRRMWLCYYHDSWPGAVRPNLEWETELIGPLPNGLN